MSGRRARRLALLALAGGAAATAWETQRRRDARRVAADPENAELSREVRGRVLSVRSADGTRLHAEVFGPEQAPTIVLVHGWTNTLDVWHYQLRDLSEEFRVVAYDQRGHGRSEQSRERRYTDEALSDDLQAVLDAAVPAGTLCLVAGHSMGGITVVAWAGRHAGEVRERLAAAALVDTGMGDLAHHVRVLRPRRRGVRLYETLAPLIAGSSLPLARISTPLSHRLLRYTAYAPDAGAAAVAFGERMTLETPAASRGGFGRMFYKLDLFESLRCLDVPTLVLVGELDRLTPPWHARRMAEELPRVEAVVEIPGVAHMVPLEANQLLTARLRELAHRHLGAALPVAAAAR